MSGSEHLSSSSETRVDPSEPKGSRLLSRVLVPALRVWIRAQVQRIEQLQVQLQAGDRQLLGGYLPQIRLAAQAVIYQGLHLSQIEVQGSNIRVNLGQILRGHPLQLLEPVTATIDLALQEADLQASLRSTLLQQALTDLVSGWLELAGLNEILSGQGQLRIDPQAGQLFLAPQALTLALNGVTEQGHVLPIVVRTGIELASPQQLRLLSPHYLPGLNARRGFPLTDLEGYIIDLGREVALAELSLLEGQLRCRGTITVFP
uniref:DUF2993 domain-containing protein n=1 Tax=Cyanothece sp. (strain PCC 7425 / ATCC 29141) TaxID=395961 RepID=B8HNQ9_CYAP4